MGNLTTPKRSDATVSKLGTDKSQHQFQGRSLPEPAHRITRSVSEMPAPDALSDDTKAMWQTWVETASWLAPSDIPALEYLCGLIERRNALITGNNASAIANVEGLIARLMASMGFTPQSRIQLGLATVEAESKLEMFLNGTPSDTSSDTDSTGTDG